MFISRKFSLPSSLAEAELESTFKNYCVGTHKIENDGSLEKSILQYDLGSEYDKYVLNRKEGNQYLLRVVSSIHLKQDETSGSVVQVATRYTQAATLIIVFLHLILILSSY